MKKYICPNCGFISRRMTKKERKRRICKNCGCTQVYDSKKVLESMMRMDILKGSKYVSKSEWEQMRRYERNRVVRTED